MTEKQRLDTLLVEKGFETSRERAKAIIMSGIVYVNNQKVDKAGYFCESTDLVEVRGNTMPYVSRGGLKIAKALEYFHYDPTDKVVIDIGASTGGFTDCLLRHGAKKVYAVDVGYGQLAWSVRNDPRVVVMERTNIRHVKPEDLQEPPQLSVSDVSFISLRLVLPVAKELLTPDGEVLTLIKPQFEAGREKVGKKGVVREKSTHIEVLENTLEFAKSIGFSVKGLTFSPITGPEGNIEFLAWLSLPPAEEDYDIEKVVEEAHQTMRKPS